MWGFLTWDFTVLYIQFEIVVSNVSMLLAVRTFANSFTERKKKKRLSSFFLVSQNLLLGSDVIPLLRREVYNYLKVFFVSKVDLYLYF